MPLKGEFGSLQFFSIGRMPSDRNCLASMQALQSRRVSSTPKLLGGSDQRGQTAPLGG
jgi:hypothetical protein